MRIAERATLLTDFKGLRLPVSGYMYSIMYMYMYVRVCYITACVHVLTAGYRGYAIDVTIEIRPFISG